MIDVFKLMFSYGFIARALIAGILISICAALLGTTLVTKRYSMIGDGLSHIGFGSLALATALKIAVPLYFSLPLVILAAFIILKLDESGKIKGDSAIAMMSVGALSFGVIILKLANTSDSKITGYMFGSILTLNTSDLYITTILSVVLIALFIIFYQKIFSVTFDEQFAYATGVNTKIYNGAISIFIAVTIVIGINLMGSMLISGLIIFPPLTAMLLCKRFKSVIITSTIISAAGFFAGMTFSIRYSLPPGATIIFIDTLFFIVVLIFKRMQKLFIKTK